MTATHVSLLLCLCNLCLCKIHIAAKSPTTSRHEMSGRALDGVLHQIAGNIARKVYHGLAAVPLLA